MAIDRMELINRMRQYAKLGFSFNKFYEIRSKFGFKMNRAAMLSEWHDIAEAITKEGAARGIKVGYVPPDKIAEMRNWEFSGQNEYLYKFAYRRINAKGKILETGFVNITSQEPMLIEDAVAELWERSFSQSPTDTAEERIFNLESVYHSPKK